MRDDRGLQVQKKLCAGLELSVLQPLSARLPLDGAPSLVFKCIFSVEKMSRVYCVLRIC